MSKSLYIGNLASEVTENDLTTNFSEVGKVLSARIIKDKYSGTSKGFGFVEMETPEEAKEIIKRFNGGELCGKTIRVSEAKPKKDQGGGGRGGYGGGGGRSRY